MGKWFNKAFSSLGHRNVFLKDSVFQQHSNRRHTKYIKVDAPGLKHERWQCLSRLFFRACTNHKVRQ